MPPSSQLNGFAEYKRLIISELERLDSSQKLTTAAMVDLKLEIAVMRTKVNIYAALIGGAVGTAASLIVKFIT